MLAEMKVNEKSRMQKVYISLHRQDDPRNATYMKLYSLHFVKRQNSSRRLYGNPFTNCSDFIGVTQIINWFIYRILSVLSYSNFVKGTSLA